MPEEPLDFETALKELEEVVASLESGELVLEDSLKAFEKGINLTRFCQKSLEDAELKVQQLTKNNDLVDALPTKEK
ncbi:MAG: exodeoxyribonuclease VII small subunit [Gammaproteobacteria bacterium]|nr:exodeoxyribonuclease VII small subunit [Gammaproteobacteria bacterium]|tara:strand:- start:811 stop:1038 length:228 start_codon:yes stop_codon:yes gene_type:complete